jgi:hypothetical protein
MRLVRYYIGTLMTILSQTLMGNFTHYTNITTTSLQLTNSIEDNKTDMITTVKDKLAIS